MAGRRKAVGVKRTKGDSPAVCGLCMGYINRPELLKCLRENVEYVHQCGRVLVRAR